MTHYSSLYKNISVLAISTAFTNSIFVPRMPMGWTIVGPLKSLKWTEQLYDLAVVK